MRSETGKKSKRHSYKWIALFIIPALLSLYSVQGTCYVPEDLDFRTVESFGMDLIRMMAEDQLDGKIEIDRTAGTKFSIRIKRQRYRPRI